MPAPQPLTIAVRAALAGRGDHVRAVAQEAYLKGAQPFRGLSKVELTALLRPVLAQAALWPTGRADWERVIRELYDEAPFREDRYAGLAILRHRRSRPYVDADALPLLDHLIVTGAWWDLVDDIDHSVGVALRGEPGAVAPVMRAWSRDRNLWRRRVSIICQLDAKQETDVELLEEVIVANLGDREFFIRKAIGWALRQHARTDPGWVRAFVDRHQDGLSGLSRREALKHL